MQEVHPSAVCALTAKQQLDDEEKGLARVVASQLVASQDSLLPAAACREATTILIHSKVSQFSAAPSWLRPGARALATNWLRSHQFSILISPRAHN